MKKTIYYLILFPLLFLSSCNKKEDTNKKEGPVASQITNVLAYFKSEIASDGAYDSESDYDNTKTVFDYETLKDDKIFWCYDTMSLLKIELLGKVSDASICFINSQGVKTEILKNGTIDGSYSIVPMQSNSYLNNGTIKIFSGNKLLKQFDIVYEGCL